MKSPMSPVYFMHYTLRSYDQKSRDFSSANCGFDHNREYRNRAGVERWGSFYNDKESWCRETCWWRSVDEMQQKTRRVAIIRSGGLILHRALGTNHTAGPLSQTQGFCFLQFNGLHSGEIIDQIRFERWGGAKIARATVLMFRLCTPVCAKTLSRYVHMYIKTTANWTCA